jgi:hypothetical protein
MRLPPIEICCSGGSEDEPRRIDRAFNGLEASLQSAYNLTNTEKNRRAILK